MIVFTGERALLLTDFRYEEQARQQASDWEIVRYQGDPLETLRNVLQEMKVTRLGFEEDYVTCGQLKTFIAKLDQVSFIGLEDPVGLLRAVKDPDEIMYIGRPLLSAIRLPAYSGYNPPGLKEKT